MKYQKHPRKTSDGQLCVQFPLEASLFFAKTLEDNWMPILYKIVSNVRFVLFMKTSIKDFCDIFR